MSIKIIIMYSYISASDFITFAGVAAVLINLTLVVIIIIKKSVVFSWLALLDLIRPCRRYIFTTGDRL